MGRESFFGRNLVGQENWARRGADDAKLAGTVSQAYFDNAYNSLDARLTTLETKFLLWSQRYAARAQSTASTGVPNATTTKITFNSVTYQDQSGLWRTASNDYLAPVAGLYAIAATLYISGGTILTPMIFVNGSPAAYGSRYAISPGDMIGMVYDEISLAAGATVDIRVENASGSGTATTNTNALGLPRVSIHRRGPAPPSVLA